jgi:hypothetical protein
LALVGEGTGIERGEEAGNAIELLAPFFGANRLEQEAMIRKRTIKDTQLAQPPPASFCLYRPILSTIRYSRPRKSERLGNSPDTDISGNSVATNADREAFLRARVYVEAFENADKSMKAKSHGGAGIPSTNWPRLDLSFKKLMIMFGISSNISASSGDGRPFFIFILVPVQDTDTLVLPVLRRDRFIIFCHFLTARHTHRNWRQK